MTLPSNVYHSPSRTIEDYTSEKKAPQDIISVYIYSYIYLYIHPILEIHTSLWKHHVSQSNTHNRHDNLEQLYTIIFSCVPFFLFRKKKYVDVKSTNQQQTSVQYSNKNKENKNTKTNKKIKFKTSDAYFCFDANTNLDCVVVYLSPLFCWLVCLFVCLFVCLLVLRQCPWCMSFWVHQQHQVAGETRVAQRQYTHRTGQQTQATHTHKHYWHKHPHTETHPDWHTDHSIADTGYTQGTHTSFLHTHTNLQHPYICLDPTKHRTHRDTHTLSCPTHALSLTLPWTQTHRVHTRIFLGPGCYSVS